MSQDVESRLAKLEGENRRLRRMALALAAIPFVVGYASPNDKIEATEFVVRDKAGAVRAHLFVDEAGKTQLALRDKDGKSAAILTAGEGGSLSLGDKGGKTNVVVGPTSGKSVIAIEEDGKVRAALSSPKTMTSIAPTPSITIDAQDPWATTN